MKRTTILLLLVLGALPAFSQAQEIKKILIEVPKGNRGETTLIAIDRIREYSGVLTHVVFSPDTEKERSRYDLTIVLGLPQDSPELTAQWQKHVPAKSDAYLVQTLTGAPLTIVASGINERAILYAAYRVADLLKAKAGLSDLELFFEPKIAERYLSFGATTHGRRHYRPALFAHSLGELPRYGYNGVIIYPGGGTPIGRRSSPVLEKEDGTLYSSKENTSAWKRWFSDIDAFHLDIMMAIPPLIPPGYEKKEIDEFYIGGPEPKNYISNLQSHFRKFLEMLTHDYPEIDRYLFNSTEGATFGNNKRFFGHPDPERYPTKAYVANSERIMRAYFDVLEDFFKEDLDKVGFWTHSFGLTSHGIVKMREVLFEYPEVMIVEDDFWNNNLWPYDLPAMAYLPEDLRAKISTQNPFALFQIATDAEYFGGGNLPNAYPGSHIRSANEAIDRHAEMVIQRIDLHDRTPYGTLFGHVEIIPFAASKQLWSPTPDEPGIWKEWANRRFGKQAAPYVINALQESETIILKGLDSQGLYLLGWGSEINPRFWYIGDLTRFRLFSKPGERFVDKTADSVIFSPEYTAYQMQTESIPIKTYLKNKDKALESVEYGLSQIEKAKAYLAEADYVMLHETFVKGKNVIEALKLLGKTAYAANLVLSNYDQVEDPVALFKSSISNLEAYIKTDKLMPEMDRNLEKIIKNYKKVLTDI